MKLEGSCRCGAVKFTVESDAPVPYQRCYCTICRKQAGGGGYAVNLGADNRTLKVTGGENITIYRAEIDGETSNAERNFCSRCGSALWLYSPDYPDLVHPFASAIDTELPVPPAITSLMLKHRQDWMELADGEGDKQFQIYPDESLADWHERHGLTGGDAS